MKNELIEKYKINEMEGFIEYDILKDSWEKEPSSTYNPQKTEGKPYKNGAIPNDNNVYGTKREKGKITKTDRHPTSILPDMACETVEEHENLYVFNGMNEDNEDLINYSKKILKFINKTKAEIKRNIKDADHFFRYSKDNFSICNKKTYNELIEKYKINEMEGFIEYDDIFALKSIIKTKYNPQKTEGKPYEIKENDLTNSYYRGGNKEYKSLSNINKGDRHPTSILPDMACETVEEHENVYVFDNTNYYDIENEEEKLNLNLDIINYSKKILEYIGKSKKEIIKEAGTGIDHFFRYSRGNFSLPIKKNYEKLIEKYKINEMEGFIEYDILKDSWEKEPSSTYNPQKTEGKEIKMKRKVKCKNVYGDLKLPSESTYKDRHPTSILPDDIESTILEYNNPHKTIHRTQKPVKLLEWLIKTYSNKEDTVMDFCMGSGTAGVACKNTNRKFIGVEMDNLIFELAKKRIDDVEII